MSKLAEEVVALRATRSPSAQRRQVKHSIFVEQSATDIEAEGGNQGRTIKKDNRDEQR